MQRNKVIQAGTITVNGNQTPSSGAELTIKGNELVVLGPTSSATATIISPKTIITVGACTAGLRVGALSTMSMEAQPEQELISAYPNPASDMLIVETVNPSSNFEVALYNSQGSMKKSGRTEKGKLELQVSDLPEGLYYLYTRDGKRLEKKQMILMLALIGAKK